MLTGENGNNVRIGEGTRETQCKSRGRQRVGDEICRRGRPMKIDAL